MSDEKLTLTQLDHYKDNNHDYNNDHHHHHQHNFNYNHDNKSEGTPF